MYCIMHRCLSKCVYVVIDDMSKRKIILVIVNKNNYLLIEGFNRYMYTCACFCVHLCNTLLGMCVLGLV